MSNGRATPRGRPSRRWFSGFWVAGGLAVIGLVAALGWLVGGLLSATDDTEGLARGDLPGTVTTQVTEPRPLVVYYEGDPVPDLSRLDLHVTGPGGVVVAVTPYRLDVRYDAPGTPDVVGRAVATFEAGQAGTYLVDSPYIPADGARLAVGDDVGNGFVQTALGPATLAVCSLLLAAGVAVLTAVLINRGFRRES